MPQPSALLVVCRVFARCLPGVCRVCTCIICVCLCAVTSGNPLRPRGRGAVAKATGGRTGQGHDEEKAEVGDVIQPLVVGLNKDRGVVAAAAAGVCARTCVHVCA